jgi:hypothetical protein
MEDRPPGFSIGRIRIINLTQMNFLKVTCSADCKCIGDNSDASCCGRRNARTSCRLPEYCIDAYYLKVATWLRTGATNLERAAGVQVGNQAGGVQVGNQAGGNEGRVADRGQEAWTGWSERSHGMFGVLMNSGGRLLDTVCVT